MAVSTATPKKKFQWWAKGECVVELVSSGHFPTSVLVKLPSGLITEIELNELE